jgi:preprotein translocase subunit SecA
MEEIKERHAKGQPVLVGTIAIEKSEYLSALLQRNGVPHEVLNAKNHEREAAIIAKAGHLGSVTIATNMAGRGTDIKLGEGVKEVGGLLIIGTERHEARRIDNQLRGRAGRQGDPGASQFYVSLEDELMRRFGGDKLKNLMDKLGLPDDQPIQNAIISKSIENAQTKIEGFNFDIRKHVLDYDDVMNKQREVVYKKRREILEMQDTKSEMLDYLNERVVAMNCLGEEGEWDIPEIVNAFCAIVFAEIDITAKLEEIRKASRFNNAEKITQMTELLMGIAKEIYNKKESMIGMEQMRMIEKSIILQTTDMTWMNHLDEIDYLREGIGLRGYGQRDPLIEYKKEAFDMFSHLMNNIRGNIVNTIFRVNVGPVPSEQPQEKLSFSGAATEVEQFGAVKDSAQSEKKNSPIVHVDKIGRNDPCPCGSGKKFKKCCGA